MPAVAKLDTVRFEIDVPVELADEAVIPKVALFAWPLMVKAAPAPPATLAFGALSTNPGRPCGTLIVTAPPDVTSDTFCGISSGNVSAAVFGTVAGPTTVTVTAKAATFPITWSARVIVRNAHVLGLPLATFPFPAVSLPLTGSTV